MSDDDIDPTKLTSETINPGDITTGKIRDGDIEWVDLAPVYHPPVFHYGHSHRDHEPHAVDWQWVALGVCAFVLLLMIVLSTLGVL